jgi:hypothetical protein
MKNIILGLAIALTILTACNSKNNKSTESQNRSSDTIAKSQAENTGKIETSADDAKSNGSIKEILSTYLKMKNDFADDNTTEAASEGKELVTSIVLFDKTALTPDQKQVFEAVEDDAKENAEHIGENGGNITHQREHFALLSNDIYDLAKAFGAEQVLYRFYCPMVDNGKGAYWISETKEIKNPYFGKKMPTCGSIKEEIK